ncbi:MAG: hypothetical protein ACK4PR_02255, partial [Gammaproteobacteria bacterium]
MPDNKTPNLFKDFDTFYNTVYWVLFVKGDKSEEAIFTNHFNQPKYNTIKQDNNNKPYNPSYIFTSKKERQLRLTQFLEIKQEMDFIKQNYTTALTTSAPETASLIAIKRLTALLNIYLYVIWQESAGQYGGISIGKDNIIRTDYNKLNDYGQCIAKLISRVPDHIKNNIPAADLQFQYDRYLEKRISAFCQQIKNNDTEEISLYNTSITTNTTTCIENSSPRINSTSTATYYDINARLTLLAATATLPNDLDKKLAQTIYKTYQDCQRILLHWSTDLEGFDPKNADGSTSYEKWLADKAPAALNKLFYSILDTAQTSYQRKTLKEMSNFQQLSNILKTWFAQRISQTRTDIQTDEWGKSGLTILTPTPLLGKSYLLINDGISAQKDEQVSSPSSNETIVNAVTNTIFRLLVETELNQNALKQTSESVKVFLRKFSTDLPFHKELRRNTDIIFEKIEQLTIFVVQLRKFLATDKQFIEKNKKNQFNTKQHQWLRSFKENVDTLQNCVTQYDSIFTITSNASVTLNHNVNIQLTNYFKNLLDGEVIFNTHSLAELDVKHQIYVFAKSQLEILKDILRGSDVLKF